MINIILLILKIILFAFLSLLGLAILLILIVVFAPIRYKAEICYKESARVRAKLRYLFFSANIYYDQQQNVNEQIIRIFGFKIGKKRARHSDDNEESDLIDDIEDIDDLTENKIEVSEEAIEDNEQAEAVKEAIENNEQAEVCDDAIEDNEQAEVCNDAIEDNEQAEASKDEEEKKHRKEKKQKISIKERWAELKKKYRKIKKFWNLECTEKARAYIKKYVFGAIKHLLPRKIKGYVRYGFEDPSTTGMVTGYLSLMPFMYQKGFYPQPDFENKIIYADVKVKGHFFIGYYIRIIFKPCIWKTLFAAKKYFG